MYTCTPAPTLRSSLEGHNDAFETLLKLIPAKYYLPQEHSEQPSQYQKHTRKTKQAVKEALKTAKKEKLDPENNKSVLEIRGGNGAAMGLDVEWDDIASDGGDENEGGDDMEDEEQEEKEIVPMVESGGIEELRKKLRARVEELKRRNRGPNGEAGDKDELLEERRKQRAAMRERRRKRTKEKIRCEAGEWDGNKRKEGRKEVNKGPQTKTQLLVPDTGFALTSKLHDPQGKHTNVTFSSIAGAPKKGQQLKTMANPRQALEKIAVHKEKLTNLPEEKRRVMEEKEKWAKAEAKLEGVKVRDDETRLKKAAKRKEKEKAKSKKAWDERKEQVAAAMSARQKKRTDNIAVRNDRRKKRGGKAKARPGFEGKTFGKGKKA